MILGSCLSLQFGAALATSLFPALGSWGTTTLRLGIAGAILLLIARPKVHRFDAAQWRAVIVFGIVMGSMNGFFYAAIDRIPLGTAVALEFLGPLAVSALLSTRRSDLLWVVLALGGVSLFGLDSLTGDAGLDLLGVLFALIAALFWGLYVLSSAKVGALIPGQGGLAVAVMIGALANLPLGAPGAIAGMMEPGLLAIALGTAVMASVLPYTLELAALRRLPRHVFGILLSLEPVLALVAGLALLGQDTNALRLLAAALVVGASIGVTLTARRSAPTELPTESLEDQDLPVPTHATVTGELAVLSEEDLAVAGWSEDEALRGEDEELSSPADAPSGSEPRRSPASMHG